MGLLRWARSGSVRQVELTQAGLVEARAHRAGGGDAMPVTRAWCDDGVLWHPMRGLFHEPDDGTRCAPVDGWRITGVMVP